MKLTNAFTVALAAWMPKQSFSQTCTDASGTEVSDSGFVDIMLPGETRRTSFIRRGTENCPCSYVQATCKLGNPVFDSGGTPVEGGPNDECNKLVIDGVDAAANGYPVVNMKHILQLCNYNDNTTNRIKMVEAPARAKVEFLYPDGEGQQIKLVDQSWNEQVLAPKDCFQNRGVKKVPSNRPKYFMEAILQGTQETSGGSFVPGGFCYAYSYNKINIRFFYEPYGECEMRTELDCVLTDGSGRKCKDYINANIRSCNEFEGTFTAKACNDNDRDVQIQDGASNYKINIYEKKPDGSYRRKKEKLPEVIKAKECANFSTTRKIKPCEKNFWQVNVEGKEYIEDAEFGWVFKDKDCLSYSFDELPVANPLAPTPAPTTVPPSVPGTISPAPSGVPTSRPSVSTAPTGVPTSSPTVSSRPTLSGTAPPTVTVEPTGSPTMNPTLSTAPTGSPTISPTLSTAPTGVPTFGPTLSTAPTGVPTSGPTVSTAPTGAPTSGPTVSTAPTGVPTSGPTVSTAPTGAPTFGPTLSTAPTGVPTLNPTVSVQPTDSPSSGPTVSTAPTGVPTSGPTVSTAPTAGPTSGPSVSVQPTGVPTFGPTVSTAPTAGPTSGPSVSVQPTSIPTSNPTSSHVPTKDMVTDPVPTRAPIITKSKGKGKAGKNKRTLNNGDRKRRRAA